MCWIESNVVYIVVHNGVSVSKTNDEIVQWRLIYRCECDGENVAFIEGQILWVVAIKCVQCHNFRPNGPFHLMHNMMFVSK